MIHRVLLSFALVFQVAALPSVAVLALLPPRPGPRPRQPPPTVMPRPSRPPPSPPDPVATPSEPPSPPPAPVPRCPAPAPPVEVLVSSVDAWIGVADVRREDLSRLVGMSATGWPSRILPHTPDGQPHGAAMYGVRRDSLFYAAGFRSGDVIQSVNGLPVWARQTMDLLALRDAAYLDFALTRRGQPARLLVVIHDGPIDGRAAPPRRSPR